MISHLLQHFYIELIASLAFVIVVGIPMILYVMIKTRHKNPCFYRNTRENRFMTVDIEPKTQCECVYCRLVRLNTTKNIDKCVMSEVKNPTEAPDIRESSFSESDLS